MSKIDQQLFGVKAHALEKEYEQCPLCGGELSIKHSKHGSFLGCNQYPTCEYSRPLVQHEAMEAQVITGSSCPDCGHELAVKSGRYGMFIGCTQYPQCQHIEKAQATIANQVDCPICSKGHMEQRTSRLVKVFLVVVATQNASLLLTIRQSQNLALIVALPCWLSVKLRQVIALSAHKKVVSTNVKSIKATYFNHCTDNYILHTIFHHFERTLILCCS